MSEATYYLIARADPPTDGSAPAHPYVVDMVQVSRDYMRKVGDSLGADTLEEARSFIPDGSQRHGMAETDDGGLLEAWLAW